MKYLKRIFESLDKDELRDFCEMNLAYLMDDPDFEIRIEDTDWKKPSRFVSVVLCKTVDLGSGQMMRTTFEWGEVKDQFIPFVYHLKKKYNILEVYKHKRNFEFFADDAHPPIIGDDIIFTCRDEDNRPSTSYYKIQDLDTVSLDNVVSISFYILLHEDQK
jgi:hypothetical protein